MTSPLTRPGVDQLTDSIQSTGPSTVGSRPSGESRDATSLTLHLPSGPVPLGFVEAPDAVLLVARDRAARWPVTVLRAGWVRLLVGDRVVEGTVDLVVDPQEKAEVLARFRQKYGPEAFVRWYDHPARVLRVRPAAGPGGRPAAPDYHAWLRAEFDNVADDYDRHIFGNRINRLLRERSLARLRATFGGARTLIEIGCGSGTETLPLLEEGHEVLCIDLSERMLEIVRTKARKAGVGERLRTRHAPAAQLPGLVAELGEGAFDAGYSTYGALNCEADLGGLPPSLHALLRHDAPFVAGVYNRWCAFELAGYGLVGRWGRAFGRASLPVAVGASRFCVDVFAHSPRGFAAEFAPWFSPESWEAVPFLLPPSDMVSYAEKFARHFDRLARYDRWLGSVAPFRSFGDHFLMTLRRVDAVPRSAEHRAAKAATSAANPPGDGLALPRTDDGFGDQGVSSATAPVP